MKSNFTAYEMKMLSWLFTETPLLPFSLKKMHRREWLVAAVVSFWTCGDNHICFDYMHINIYMHIKHICFANLFGMGNNLLKMKKLQLMDFEILPVLLAGPLEERKNKSKPVLSGWVITNSLVASRLLGLIMKLLFQHFSHCEIESCCSYAKGKNLISSA